VEHYFCETFLRQGLAVEAGHKKFCYSYFNLKDNRQDAFYCLRHNFLWFHLFDKLARPKMDLVKNIKTSVSVLELKRLLVELNDKRKDIGIRFRMIGEMWKPNFFRIIDFNDQGLIVVEESGNKLFFLKDLSIVMQFEIDARFQSFEPHHHYDVVPDAISIV
jgi:hypothetical protein